MDRDEALTAIRSIARNLADERHSVAAMILRQAADTLTTPAGAPAADIEALAAKVHDAYLEACAELGWSVSPANQTPYDQLSEESKELDRTTVRAVLAGLPGVTVVKDLRHDWQLSYAGPFTFDRLWVCGQCGREHKGEHPPKGTCRKAQPAPAAGAATPGMLNELVHIMDEMYTSHRLGNDPAVEDWARRIGEVCQALAQGGKAGE